jgi:hypothetical protein
MSGHRRYLARDPQVRKTVWTVRSEIYVEDQVITVRVYTFDRVSYPCQLGGEFVR